jgi:hypothetical protein
MVKIAGAGATAVSNSSQCPDGRTSGFAARYTDRPGEFKRGDSCRFECAIRRDMDRDADVVDGARIENSYAEARNWLSYGRTHTANSVTAR